LLLQVVMQQKASTKALTKAELKAEANRQVGHHHLELIQLSLKIHANPELAFRERKASTWLTGYLRKNGFRVEKGVAGLPTAFRAVYGGGQPVIALLAEYDALPEIGHACGHNIIGVSAAGAGVASRCVVDSCGGTVVVLGTPAEELFGGKDTMLKAGLFDAVDAAMIAHPGRRNTTITEALACIRLEVEFFGKAAHAAAHPEQGINALDAMILAFNALNSLRQHIKDKARIHGIITHGGDAANIVPAYSAATLLVRAPDNAYLDELKQKVLNCFAGAAQASGARLDHKWAEIVYATMNNNLSLAELFAQNLESIGRRVEPFEPRFGFGSTDMGNVSQVVPAIHPTVAIAPSGVLLHSAEFTQAAASKSGHAGLLDAARALAMTVVDLLSEPEALVRVKEEFASSGGKGLRS